MFGGVEVAAGLAGDGSVFDDIASGVADPAGQVTAVKERAKEAGPLDFADVDVAEVDRVAVALQLDLAEGEDGLAVVPVVFHDNIVHDALAVEIDGDLIADHLDTEGVPLADGLVCDLGGIAGVGLVVVKAAGADLAIAGIPDLDLRGSAEIDAAVAFFGGKHPIDEHFEIAVVLAGGR